MLHSTQVFLHSTKMNRIIPKIRPAKLKIDFKAEFLTAVFISNIIHWTERTEPPVLCH